MCGLLNIIIGAISTYKVAKGRRGIKELVITTSIILAGLCFIGLGLCLAIWEYGCGTHHTYENYRQQYLFLFLLNIADVHLWLFAMKYLEKGIEYTRFKSKDRVSFAVKVTLYSLLFIYQLYQAVVWLIIYVR